MSIDVTGATTIDLKLYLKGLADENDYLQAKIEVLWEALLAIPILDTDVEVEAIRTKALNETGYRPEGEDK